MSSSSAFPATRLRRLRQSDWTRRLVRETSLSPSDLVWAVVVHDRDEARTPVPSMPGVERLSVGAVVQAAREARDLGIPALALFANIDGTRKDATASAAVDPDGLIPTAIKAIKDAVPDIGLITDVALDCYADH